MSSSFLIFRQEEEELAKYAAEEAENERVLRERKERITRTKQELAEKKAREEQQALGTRQTRRDSISEQYANEEKQAQETADAMRDRIAQRKRALAEKKAAQEQEDLEKYSKEQADEGADD